MSSLRYMEVAGDYAGMGEAHGEEYRDEVREFISRRIHHLVEFVRRRNSACDLSRADVLSWTRRVVAAHRDYDRDLWLEFEGIASGAGVGIDELLACNGLTDIRDMVLKETLDMRVSSGGRSDRRIAVEGVMPEGDECTSFGASRRECGGPPIIGQTWDMHPDARDFLLVLRRRPARGHETLSLTTVGCLSLLGVNSAGVAICTNNLFPVDPQPGVSYLFTISKALTSSSAKEAARIIEYTGRLSGHNFVVADTQEVVDVETTATQSVSMTIRHGVHIHANRYVDRTLSQLQHADIDLAGSLWRERRMRAGFDRASRPITASTCWTLLSDNVRGDGVICNEDYVGAFGPVATAATAVILTGRREVVACVGGGRLGSSRRFQL